MQVVGPGTGSHGSIHKVFQCMVVCKGHPIPNIPVRNKYLNTLYHHLIDHSMQLANDDSDELHTCQHIKLWCKLLRIHVVVRKIRYNLGTLGTPAYQVLYQYLRYLH